MPKDAARPHLAELSVRDLALISELRLELGPGLTVLTGETGAGKSMLVDALLAVSGARVGAEMVREGAERARVEAVVAQVNGELRSLLESEDLLDEEGGDLVLARDIQAGRAPARVNQRTVPVGTLADIGSALVSVHGQNAQLRLSRPAVQRDLLDRYGDLAAERAQVRDAHAALTALEAERGTLGGDPRERERRMDLLRHEHEDIAVAGLRAEEETLLAAELARARSAEQLRAGALTARERLDADRSGVRDQVARAARDLAALAQIDAALTPHAERLGAVEAEVEDLAAELRRYADGVEVDEDGLARLEKREEDLERLRRRYGESVADIIAYGERAADELARLERAAARLTELDGDIARARAVLDAACAALRAGRRRAAKSLARAIEAELRDLEMPHCRFEITLEDQAPDASGADKVRFLIAPNPGEPAAPVETIASGGELSRIMLALEVALAAHGQTPILVFDEVDAGVGGRLGDILGRKLWSLARSHQVLCVSHLAQLAAYADTNVRVRKEVKAGRSHVRADILDPESTAAELAAMLGAADGKGALAAGAREILASAAAFKRGTASPGKRRA